MKKQKDVYSKVFSEFIFSDEQIELLHNTLFGMLMDIKKVCDKYNIDILLAADRTSPSDIIWHAHGH